MADQIVRVWKGYGTQAGVDRYCRKHFQNSVLPHLRSVDGFVDARVLTRALVEPAVRELLSRFDDRVTHFTLALAVQ